MMLQSQFQLEILWRMQIFMQALHKTDKVIAHFTARLEAINHPTPFVYFGDHRPILSPKLFTKDEMHQTDYFIYQND